MCPNWMDPQKILVCSRKRTSRYIIFWRRSKSMKSRKLDQALTLDVNGRLWLSAGDSQDLIGGMDRISAKYVAFARHLAH